MYENSMATIVAKLSSKKTAHLKDKASGGIFQNSLEVTIDSVLLKQDPIGRQDQGQTDSRQRRPVSRNF